MGLRSLSPEEVSAFKAKYKVVYEIEVEHMDGTTSVLYMRLPTRQELAIATNLAEKESNNASTEATFRTCCLNPDAADILDDPYIYLGPIVNPLMFDINERMKVRSKKL